MVKFRRKSPIAQSAPKIKRVGLVFTKIGKMFKPKEQK